MHYKKLANLSKIEAMENFDLPLTHLLASFFFIIKFEYLKLVLSFLELLACLNPLSTHLYPLPYH